MLRTLLAAGIAVTFLATAAPAAQAQLTVTQDKQGDSARDVDAKKVTVRHGERRVGLNSRMFLGNKLPHEMWHLVDTHGDGSPEFLVFVVIRNEVDPQPSVGVRRIDRFPSRKDPYDTLHDGKPVDCDLHFARKRDNRKLLNVVTGRGCYRTDGQMPDRLRVSTFGTFEWGTVTDSVPGWRKYGAWITSD